MLGYYTHNFQEDRYKFSEELQPISTKPTKQDQEKKIVLFKRRWFMLFIFSTLSASNGINWITYAPIATTVIREYKVNAWHVNALSMSYMILFIPGIFPASQYIDKYSLHYGFIVGALLNGVGGLIRVLPWPFVSISEAAPYSIIPAYVGQFLTAAAQPFLLGLPPKLSQNWFGEHERVTATAIGALANQIGTAMGFFIAPIVVPTTGDSWNITLLMIYTAVFGMASLILIILFFKSKPTVAPSRSSLILVNNNNNECLNQFQVLKLLIKDVHYMNIFTSFGIIMGVFFAITTVLEQLLNQANFPPDTTIVLGTIFVLIGIFGAMLFGWLADRTRAYKILLIISIFLSFLPSVLFAVVFQLFQQEQMGDWSSQISIYVAGALMGFFMTALLPLCMDLSVEITFPLPEATVCNILMLSTQLFAIIFVVVFTVLLQFVSVDSVNYTLVGSVGLACFLILFFHAKNKRLAAEAEN